MEEQTKEILINSLSDSQSLSIKNHAREAVLN